MDYPVLMVTLGPYMGRNRLHTYPVNEIMYAIAGRDEKIKGDKTFKIELGLLFMLQQVFIISAGIMVMI